jgi:hypothetical protein
MKNQRQPSLNDGKTGETRSDDPAPPARRRNRLRGYPARGEDISQRTAQPPSAEPGNTGDTPDQRDAGGDPAAPPGTSSTQGDMP